MGTRGLFAYRYKGKIYPGLLALCDDCVLGYYYTRYNHCDSYPDGLGQDLVNSIPVSQEEFESESRWQYLYTQHNLLLFDRMGCGPEKALPKNVFF